MVKNHFGVYTYRVNCGIPQSFGANRVCRADVFHQSYLLVLDSTDRVIRLVFTVIVPFFRIIVLDPSSGLNRPLHVASPDCATLYSMSPEEPEPLICLWDVVRSYMKHLNRSSVDIGMPLLWWTLPTRNLYEPSFHPAMHSTSSTAFMRTRELHISSLKFTFKMPRYSLRGSHAHFEPFKRLSGHC